ncbi:methyltransferase domain-containing protein [Polaribacter sp. IC073]|uniref:methyltransferase domain-containing protein n=1 Tax=Polaribacter sp. IC073 TaxID=2508540 RepID=UPI0011BEBACF|nr:methyltransferase domain-containing protein [Polaribacter sp. IC073]TXD49710.1 methyltransferase domain-containing protein [Polaribacter sp. IC073]
MDLSSNAWDNRYVNNDIGWDLGEVSTPLKAYFDQLENKEIKILIPGGGNSYEAAYLFKNGFKNVFVVDLSKTAIDNIQKRIPNFPSSQLILGNFFEMKDAFDLIIEQTFFCALNPNLREDYVVKMNQLLRPKGKLVGVLFKVPLNDDKPPFGGNKAAYLNGFKEYFQIEKMASCYNSFGNRKGRELFIKLLKK